MAGLNCPVNHVSMAHYVVAALLRYKFTKQLLIVAIFQGFPSTAQLPEEQKLEQHHE